MKLITHSGSFHADEVTACAILTSIAKYRDAEIIRTRDATVIVGAKGDDIVFDVGMIHDPEINRFDHHMGLDDPTKPYREDGTPYSSVGLIWKHFGHDLIRERHPNLSDEAVENVWRKTDKSMILKVDMIDNGIGGSFSSDDLTAIIDDINLDWDDKNSTEDEAFRKAVSFTRVVVNGRINKIASRERAYSLVVEAIKASPDPRFFELPQSMPWENAVFDGGFEDLLYVISERPEGWYCTAVPLEKGSFDKRKSFPQEWSGLREKDLAAVTGVEDAIFCHPALFICGAKSKEGLMTLLQQALDHEPNPSPAI